MLYGKKKGESTFTELVEIKDVPDTGSDPEQIEVTTLKDKNKSYIGGRGDNPAQSFLYNYTEENFHNKVMPYCNGETHDFLVKFPDGTGYTIKGNARTRINAVSQNAPIEATLTITPEAIDYKTSTQVTALLPTVSV